MFDIEDKSIRDAVKKVEHVLTYAEVFGKCTNIDPFFASCAVNAYLPRTENSKIASANSNLKLLFDAESEKAYETFVKYSFSFLPRIRSLEREGKIKHTVTSDTFPSGSHSNYISDLLRKIPVRIGMKNKRKQDVAPELDVFVDYITAELLKRYPAYMLKDVVLLGSCSTNNCKPFTRYGNAEVIKAVPEVDVGIFASEPVSVGFLRPWIEDTAKKRKVIVNPFYISADKRPNRV